MIKWAFILLLCGCSSIPLISPREESQEYYVCNGEEIRYDLSISDGETISFRKEGVSIGSYPRNKCQKLSRKSLK